MYQALIFGQSCSYSRVVYGTGEAIGLLSEMVAKRLKYIHVEKILLFLGLLRGLLGPGEV